ncbi:GPI ethanolamine phosphate transferase 2 [Cyphomyrmex costatus]|uniref:GPI ethanolamine phosphate transferase 2 n=1 Tax=Cyphomyrmex costatus TaxID=456900 RepID=A0A195CXA4_9HYME|nr:GPI ethanolamine phosphate transferase 2 [Cyphomyrmex costatus]
MVIDGLRWDFVADSFGKETMPLTNDILTNNGCLLQANLQAPTVTMPRIKAMMTGTVPNFIDIVLNFGSKPLQNDNLLLQAKKHGHKLIFYGDETWLSLFPHIFNRHDGTTSFVVTDFTEVDNNVTRHIKDEMYRDDWTVMILHYLGLDHIGHMEGPASILIKPKLREMDRIIDEIAQNVDNWKRNGVPTLFVVCGDHGMKNSGGHGGSTLEETTVPFIVIGGTHCAYQKNYEPIKIEQLDVAVTLSAALGLPIPSTNLGSVFLDNIYILDHHNWLFLLYYNTKQVFDHFRRLVHNESEIENVLQKYVNAVDLHVAWMNSNKTDIEDIIFSYKQILNEMKGTIINSIVKYDFRLMTVAVFALCQIIIILFFMRFPVWTIHKKTASFFLCSGIIYYFHSFENATSFYPTSILLFLLVIGVIYNNCELYINSRYCLCQMYTTGPIRRIVLLQIGTLLHIVSLASSSFIEEEHQTWFFLWATAIVIILYHLFIEDLVFLVNKFELSVARHRNINISLFDANSRKDLLFCTVPLLFFGHIFLRRLNSTDNRRTDQLDIFEWLNKDKIWMTIVLLIALILLILVTLEEDKYKKQSFFLNIPIVICIYLRHMCNGTVIKIPFYSSSGIYEVQIFWGIIMLSLINYGYRVIVRLKYSRQYFIRTMFLLIINTWVMISAMLHKPHNVILLPVQLMTGCLIDWILREISCSLDLHVYVYYWLGNVFYFYQGNSNSLANINIAAGYVGLRSYMPFVTGMYLIINTYSAPVLAYFQFIYYIHCGILNIVRANKIYLSWRLLTTTAYMIIVIILRDHLFVWSVFSPKLLYEATYSVIMCCNILLTSIVIMVQFIPFKSI